MTNHRVVVMLVVRLTSPNLSFISKILRCRLVLQSNLFAPGFYMHQYLLEGKSAERAAWAGSEKKKYASFAVDPIGSIHSTFAYDNQNSLELPAKSSIWLNCKKILMQIQKASWISGKTVIWCRGMCRIIIKLFSENNQLLEAVNYFRKKAP